MKSLLNLITYPILALGASIPRGTQADLSGPFIARAWSSDTDAPFHGAPINASGGKFYINRDTSTYCPDVSGLDCSQYSSKETTFVIGDGSTTISLEVSVPGGQRAPDGSLSYTQAHSAYIPEGSIITGFSREQAPESDAPIYLFSELQNWYLCPITEGEPNERTYQVFASSEDLEGCLYAELHTVSTS
ncbi:hypothetical protein F5B22DRAFT_475346 [Xylaria bambusicola]|uniref:uncharacterized protein n=1 Tax=Xylaria bambusicola TaxID=326684 RepID=UPI0020082AFC|nr:uncharacterized protein F5B22DRAFT_475346 [Xylaria bambusicola]KAI0506165.1 hypothetical protein F5B22DRAFT_475346 [Xylaria bambusicola]